jgi:hypothetical protein
VASAPGWKGVDWVNLKLPAVDKDYLRGVDWNVPPPPSLVASIEWSNKAKNDTLAKPHNSTDANPPFSQHVCLDISHPREDAYSPSWPNRLIIKIFNNNV